MAIVIAFGHRKQVGKDTCARFLSTILKTETRGYAVKTVGFADELKDTCFRLFSWAGMQPKEYYEEFPKDKEVVLGPVGKSPRQIWIEFGNKMREIYEPIWIEFIFRHQAQKADILMVKDLRYPNEFDRCNVGDHQCFKIKVERSSEPYVPDVADAALRNKPDGEWNHVLRNEGTLKDCYQQVHDELWLPLVKPLIPESRFNAQYTKVRK